MKKQAVKSRNHKAALDTGCLLGLTSTARDFFHAGLAWFKRVII
jgi:hypothetical protein